MLFNFRGREPHTKIWFSAPGIEQCSDGVFLVNHGVRTEVEPETVGLTTSHFDSNGEEIFDGDILKIAIFDEPDFVDSNECWLVNYVNSKGRFVVRNLTSGEEFSIKLLDFTSQVVGTKWDNPELLAQAFARAG